MTLLSPSAVATILGCAEKTRKSKKRDPKFNPQRGDKLISTSEGETRRHEVRIRTPRKVTFVCWTSNGECMWAPTVHTISLGLWREQMTWADWSIL